MKRKDELHNSIGSFFRPHNDWDILCFTPMQSIHNQGNRSVERAELTPNMCRHRQSGSNDYGMLL